MYTIDVGGGSGCDDGRGGGGAVRRREWRGAGAKSSMLDGDGASPVELPVATAPPCDRSRVWTVGNNDGSKPRVKCRSPHLLYIWHCATGAHQPSIGLGIPDQDASQGPSCCWANWWRSILTFSPLISSYTFKTLQLDVTLFTFSLVTLLLASSHCRSVHRACLIMTVISYRQT